MPKFTWHRSANSLRRNTLSSRQPYLHLLVFRPSLFGINMEFGEFLRRK